MLIVSLIRDLSNAFVKLVILGMAQQATVQVSNDLAISFVVVHVVVFCESRQQRTKGAEIFFLFFSVSLLIYFLFNPHLFFREIQIYFLF